MTEEPVHSYVSRRFNYIASVLVVAACGYMVWASANARDAAPAGAVGSYIPPALPSGSIDLDDDASLGTADAPVVLVLYSDFHCPYCSTFAREGFAFIKNEYVEKGRVQVIFRHFPIASNGASARLAAMAAECSREHSLFWPMHDRLFSVPDGGESAILGHASALGIDVDRFRQCLVNDAIASRVDRQWGDARRLGVDRTPTLLVGTRDGPRQARIGEIVVGAASSGRLRASIDKVLNQSSK